ncbi:hypothetical protein GN958_ATG23502, partial [Phytophthora infestans]
GAVKADAEAPQSKKESPKAKEEAKTEKPLTYHARAKEIAKALLFVPIYETVTEFKNTTVLNAVDGAIYASQLKRSSASRS